MELQQLDEGGAELTAGYDLVYKAVFQLELAALEALGQALADGLLDDAGACKTDECARLGQHDVAKAGKAGGNAAGRGVGQHTDVQPAPGRKALDGGAGLGHLHQAENALLHPGAAAGRKDDQRQFFRRRVLDGAGDLLAHGRAHAAHKEAAVQHSGHHRHAADAAYCRDSSLAEARLLGLGAELFGIPRETQHVLRGQLCVQLPETAAVQHKAQAVVRADGLMIAAVGADEEALGPDLAGGTAAALLAFHKLRLMPRHTGVPPGFELEGTLPHPAREQVSDVVHRYASACAVR